ncbi:porphobilinogen synthase [Candidatus Puniceispirillum sp.]|uniref:porphobilinogen synthase n=1 Tax=Candidatus Puniceispirillum sp. TaxID=2026719 RepID=UPI003F697D52
MSRGHFPSTRMRRNRMQSFSRRLMAETNLTVDDLIWPMFVIEGQAIDDPIASMPGQYRYSIDRLVEKASEAVALSIPAIAIFPALDSSMKDADGSGALDGNNLICRAVRAVKNVCPDLGIICDVALDPFTDHGHDGVIRDGMVANDETVDILCQQAVLQADAGCDIIAPSDMMDGRVGAVRTALDKAGHHNVIIMSYAAKYASAFYGPFRDAVKAGASLGSTGKSSYQMDPANSDEAMHEIGLDLQEGADMVIIKPGMPYLDILNRAKTEFGVPCIAYQVSGEYAMILAAAENGWLDQDRSMMESMVAFKRAGADAVITYFAPQIATILHSK